MADALAGVAQLGTQTGLLVFGEGSGDLAHHLARRIIARGQIIPGGRQQPHAAADQEGDAQLLGHQLACKPAGIFDNDGTHAVALDAVKERREARAGLDRVGAGDGGVVELFDDGEPGALGEALDRVALAFFAEPFSAASIQFFVNSMSLFGSSISEE